MIITFFGHSDYTSTSEDRRKMMFLLENTIGDIEAEFYLGGYGGFDSFALSCGREYQKTHPNVKLVFITPYITESYQKNQLKQYEKEYDSIVYPPLEKVPPKFAILSRNRWMIGKADVLITYVKYQSGGAYTAYKHAMRMNKAIIDFTKDSVTELISVQTTIALLIAHEKGHYYVGTLFRSFRAYKKLLDDPDYKRLYNEVLNHYYDYTVGELCEDREQGISDMEFVGDLMVEYSTGMAKIYPESAMVYFLEQRKKVWNLSM